MDTGSKENIAAVLKAYRTGVLVPRPGVTTYWYKGIQKESPGPPGDRSDALAQWVREHGEGRLWIENVLSPPPILGPDTYLLRFLNGVVGIHRWPPCRLTRRCRRLLVGIPLEHEATAFHQARFFLYNQSILDIPCKI